MAIDQSAAAADKTASKAREYEQDYDVDGVSGWVDVPSMGAIDASQ